MTAHNPSRVIRRVLVLVVGCVFLAGAGKAFAERPPFDPGRASFQVSVAGIVNPYHVLALPVMPGQPLSFSVKGNADDSDEAFVAVEPEQGRLDVLGPKEWRWHAPTTPGWYPMDIRHAVTGETMTFHLLVKKPRQEKRDGRMRGYRVGTYPRERFRGLDAYAVPSGLIEVPAELADLQVSPHFRLGQFLSKQPADWPQYVLVNPELLILLEHILEEANAQGYRADTLQVLSGYRTPFYNRAIGNGKHSRHQWGDAADIYIDERAPHGRMDDLNGDGRSDRADAQVLAEIAKRMQRELEMEGGIGVYGAAPHRGPFVHVDTRGFRARWEY